MLIVDNKEYRNVQQQVAKNADDIEALQNKGLYMHNILVTGKMLNGEVLDDNFTATFRLAIFNDNPNKIIDKNTLYRAINPFYNLSATGHASLSTTQSQYIVEGIRTWSNKIYLFLASTNYTPAGGSSTVLEQITSMRDAVTKIF